MFRERREISCDRESEKDRHRKIARPNGRPNPREDTPKKYTKAPRNEKKSEMKEQAKWKTERGISVSYLLEA